MALVNRNNIIVRGPAVVRVTPSGGTAYIFRSKEDVVFTPTTETFDVTSSELGVIGRRISIRRMQASFTPVGAIDATALGILWPHLSKLPGQSIFASTDTLVEVVPAAGGTSVKMFNAAVSKMPDIHISATKTLAGEVTISGAIVASSNAWSDTTHWKLADVSAPTLDALDPSAIPTAPGTVAWGSGVTDLKTFEGVTISFDMQTQDEIADDTGLYDITLTGLSASAKLTPVAGITLAALAERMGMGAAMQRGMDLPRNDLVVTGGVPGSLAVTLYGAAVAEAPMTWGATAKKLGELTLQGIRGTGNAVAAVSIVPEPSENT